MTRMVPHHLKGWVTAYEEHRQVTQHQAQQDPCRMCGNRHRDRRAPDIHERQHGAHHAAKRRLPRRHDRTDLATRQRLAQQRPCHGRNGGQGVRADPDQPQRRPEHGSSDDQLDPVQLCLSHHRRWHRAQHRRPHRRSEQPRVLHQGHAGRERHLRRRERRLQRASHHRVLRSHPLRGDARCRLCLRLQRGDDGAVHEHELLRRRDRHLPLRS